MREILFRGKRKDNGEWVYGDYSPANGKYPANIFPREDGNTYDAYEGIAVIPETVGQYTGFKDKNGKKIFEGDILSARFDDLFPENETRVYVLWREASWHIHQRELGEDGYEILDADDWEVIGNIHDNPELLEV